MWWSFSRRIQPFLSARIPSLYNDYNVAITTELTLGRRIHILQRHIVRLICASLLIIGFVITTGCEVTPDVSSLRTQEAALARFWLNSAAQTSPHNTTPLRYLRFPDHLIGHGLNNALQESLLAALLAELSGRAFVFEDHVWSTSAWARFTASLSTAGGNAVSFLATCKKHFCKTGEKCDVRNLGHTTESEVPVGVHDGGWVLYDFQPRLARVPFNAFVGGSLVGASGNNERDEHPHSQHAVSAAHYSQLCPPHTIARLSVDGSLLNPSTNSSSTTPPFSQLPSGSSGDTLITWWAKRLSLPDVSFAACIEIVEDKKRLFDWSLFGSSQILSVQPLLYKSRLLRDWSWSPSVEMAIAQNAHLFGSHSALASTSQHSALSVESVTGLNKTTASLLAGAPMPPKYPEVLAVHIRRGDFVRHCENLAEWETEWMGIFSHEGLVDRFDRYAADSPSQDDPEISESATKRRRRSHYLEHCLPTVEQVATKLRKVREEHPYLRSVYVLTNAESSWMSHLRSELVTDEWTRIVVGNDLDLDVPLTSSIGPGCTDVDMCDARGISKSRPWWRQSAGSIISPAVDMAIAVDAGVFVGNGFSSLSSNVAILRLARGMDRATIRLL